MVGMTRALIADPHIVRKVHARARGGDPPLRRRQLLHRPHLRGQRGALHPQPGDRARGDDAADDRAAPTGQRRRVVVVGAGPAGLEAARVARRARPSRRGVRGGRASRRPDPARRPPPRRRELIGIVDWRVAQLERLGVAIRIATYAGAEEVPAEAPDVVFVATGGVPNTDVLAVRQRPGRLHLGHRLRPGRRRRARAGVRRQRQPPRPCRRPRCWRRRGAEVELVTPERMFAPEIGGLNHAAYARVFQRHGVRITDQHPPALGAPRGQCAGRRARQRLRAGPASSGAVDQVVVEHGTLPVDELYHALRPGSVNLGEVDYAALLAGRPQEVDPQPGRAAIACSASATPSPAATSTPPSSMRLRLAKDL